MNFEPTWKKSSAKSPPGDVFLMTVLLYFTVAAVLFEVDKMQFGEADAVKQIVVLPPAPAPLAEGVADLRQVLEAKRALLSPPELARDRRELCRLFRSSPCPQPPFLSPFDKHVFPDLNPCFTLVKQLPVSSRQPCLVFVLVTRKLLQVEATQVTVIAAAVR